MSNEISMNKKLLSLLLFGFLLVDSSSGMHNKRVSPVECKDKSPYSMLSKFFQAAKVTIDSLFCCNPINQIMPTPKDQQKSNFNDISSGPLTIIFSFLTYNDLVSLLRTNTKFRKNFGTKAYQLIKNNDGVLAITLPSKKLANPQFIKDFIDSFLQNDMMNFLNGTQRTLIIRDDKYAGDNHVDCSREKEGHDYFHDHKTSLVMKIKLPVDDTWNEKAIKKEIDMCYLILQDRYGDNANENKPFKIYFSCEGILTIKFSAEIFYSYNPDTIACFPNTSTDDVKIEQWLNNFEVFFKDNVIPYLLETKKTYRMIDELNWIADMKSTDDFGNMKKVWDRYYHRDDPYGENASHFRSKILDMQLKEEKEKKQEKQHPLRRLVRFFYS